MGGKRSAMILPSIEEERVTRITIALQEPGRLTEQVDERKWVLVPEGYRNSDHACDLPI